MSAESRVQEPDRAQEGPRLEHRVAIDALRAPLPEVGAVEEAVPLALVEAQLASTADGAHPLPEELRGRGGDERVLGAEEDDRGGHPGRDLVKTSQM